MSKIFGYYHDDLDKTWYESSNVKYSECVDKDNELKTLRVVFNNGTKYEYKEVNVNDYLMFREDTSQGKALGKYIKSKGYEYEKLDNVNIDDIDGELDFRKNGGVFVEYTDGRLILRDSVDKEILNTKIELNENTFDTICKVLGAVGKELYIVNNDTENNGEKG